MAYKYNHDRSHNARLERCHELERKSCLRANARFVVIRGDAAYDGTGAVYDYSCPDRQTFFDDLRTARAYAHHSSDMCDCQYGIYRYEFIEGVDVC